MFNTPILLITFNRPNHTRKVLERILEAKPQALYVFQDGAREGNANDAVRCAEVREVVSELTARYAYEHKDFVLHTLYSPTNLGCGPGPAAAISWFFEHVEMGIILEDDIIPHPIFFDFMQNMLCHYAHDDRIGAVMGHNIFRKYSCCNSYYFTFNTEGTLGWGTWRRVWKNFNFNVEVDREALCNVLRNKFYLPLKYCMRLAEHFDVVLAGDRYDRWDYQFEYCLLKHGYLNIKPNSCLTSHEGDDVDATHIGCYRNSGYKMEVHEHRFQPIKHPHKIGVDFKERLRILKKCFWIYA